MKHETSVAHGFNTVMARAARARGRQYEHFPFDGQDRFTGADHLLTDYARFAIVEFKSDEADIAAEGRKPRRGVLCAKLEVNARMRELHDLCHFIAWRDLVTQAIRGNVYRHEVCHCGIFPQHKLAAPAANTSGRMSVRVFVDRFFGSIPPPCTLSREEFVEYLDWLLRETSDRDITELEVLVLTDEELGIMQPRSLDAVFRWLEGSDAAPTPSTRTPKF